MPTSTASWTGRFRRPTSRGSSSTVKGRGGTDIEHIVAAAEAHDSGLCAADRETRTRFARDLDNLTLASPGVNRHSKSDKDAAEWLPPDNRRWYAATVVRVKRRYGLSVDAAERDALADVLGEGRCE